MLRTKQLTDFKCIKIFEVLLGQYDIKYINISMKVLLTYLILIADSLVCVKQYT